MGDTKTVLVTGFGPFKEHKINASWEAVKLLPGIIVEGANLICEEIPVAYKAAEDKVKELVETHNPDLIIHCGVSSKADKITLEKCANRTGYVKTDAFGNVHLTGCCAPANEGCDVLNCQLDVEKISEALNEKNYQSCISEDAGRFLCEYTFYKSLSMCPNKTMFVHVPVLGKPFSAQDLANALLVIVEEALKQCSCT